MSDPDAYKNNPTYKGLTPYAKCLFDRAMIIIRDNSDITGESLYLDHKIKFKNIKLGDLKKFALD